MHFLTFATEEKFREGPGPRRGGTDLKRGGNAFHSAADMNIVVEPRHLVLSRILAS